MIVWIEKKKNELWDSHIKIVTKMSCIYISLKFPKIFLDLKSEILFCCWCFFWSKCLVLAMNFWKLLNAAHLVEAEILYLISRCLLTHIFKLQWNQVSVSIEAMKKIWPFEWYLLTLIKATWIYVADKIIIRHRCDVLCEWSSCSCWGCRWCCCDVCDTRRNCSGVYILAILCLWQITANQCNSL